MRPQPLTVLVVDDNAPLRAGLRLLLRRERDIAEVIEAASAEEALQILELAEPGIVVMDLEMPGVGGLAGIAALRSRRPQLPVLVLSMHEEAEHVRCAFAAGASGYLPKTAADDEIGAVVRAVAAGGRYVHRTLAPLLHSPAGASYAQ